MKSFSVVAVLFLSVQAWAAEPAAATPSAKPAELSKAVSLTVGDVSALQLATFLIGVRDLDVPLTVVYDPTVKKVVVTLYGERQTVEGAKEILTDLTRLVALFSSSAALGSLDDSNTVLIYKRRTSGWLKDPAKATEIVRRDAGKYISP